MRVTYFNYKKNRACYVQLATDASHAEVGAFVVTPYSYIYI